MKSVPFAIALVVGASPAVAQEAASSRPSAAEAARVLTSPAAQDVVALQIASLARLLLDTKVGPLAALTDPRDRIRADDTLHSVEQRRDPELDRHLYEGSRRAVATAGAVAGGALAEAAELHRTAERLRTALRPLIEAAGASENDR